MNGEHREVAINWGKNHDCLGMELDFGVKGKVKVGITKYVQDMLEDFLRRSRAQILRSHQQAMAYSMKANARSSIKIVQRHTTQWLQMH
jgi:hypothetical protein